MKDFADTLRAFEISRENLDLIRQDALSRNEGPDALDRLVLVSPQPFFILLFAASAA